MNGTEYETTQEVTEEIMSETNLSDVKVDGISVGKKVLLHLYTTTDDANTIYHFALRDQTDAEKQVAQLVDIQLALVEMYEMILG
jgi:hypothetical protein